MSASGSSIVESLTKKGGEPKWTTGCRGINEPRSNSVSRIYGARYKFSLTVCKVATIMPRTYQVVFDLIRLILNLFCVCLPLEVSRKQT